VRITTDIDSVGTGNVDFWVAIIVTGILQRVSSPISTQEFRSKASDTSISDQVTAGK
jgi:hypothetical protein